MKGLISFSKGLIKYLIISILYTAFSWLIVYEFGILGDINVTNSTIPGRIVSLGMFFQAALLIMTIVELPRRGVDYFTGSMVALTAGTILYLLILVTSHKGCYDLCGIELYAFPFIYFIHWIFWIIISFSINLGQTERR